MKVAPGASRSSSPGCAASIAACRLAPAATRTWRVAVGYAVETVARGSSASVAMALSVPVPPALVGVVGAVGVALSTVSPMLRVTVSALA